MTVSIEPLRIDWGRGAALSLGYVDGRRTQKKSVKSTHTYQSVTSPQTEGQADRAQGCEPGITVNCERAVTPAGRYT